MMHPLAIYAVQVHLADLMAEAEANRLAKLGRKPRTAGLVASLVALRPQPVRFERRTQRRFARLIDRTPAGWPDSQPARFPRAPPPARELSPAGRPPTLPGAGVLASHGV